MRRSRSPCSCSGSHARAGKTPAEIEAAVRSGLRNTVWPGRLEAIRQAPLTIIDVGHTPDAIRQSLASLKAIHGAEGWILVIGISFDKNADEIVAALAPSFDTIICTTAHHKGADAKDIAEAVHRANPRASVDIAATVADAVAMSQQLAAAHGAKDLRGRRTCFWRSNTPSLREAGARRS